MSTRKLTRSSTNKVLGGVCGGVANYFNLDPTVVRLVTAVIAVVTALFPCLVVYGILWLVLPEDSTGEIGADKVFEFYQSHRDRSPESDSSWS